jgi:Zn-dependent protease with chaperone function
MMETMKRSEILAKFLSYLGVDIRKNEIICCLLSLGLFLYILLVHPLSDPQYVILGDALLVMIFFVVGITWLRLKGNLGKKELKDYQIIVLWELASERGIKFPTNPFHVVDKKNFLALTTPEKKIFLGKDYLDNLNDDEKIFVFGHESFHYFNNEALLDAVTIVLMMVVAYGLQVSTHNFLTAIACIGPFLLVFSQMRRSGESIADYQGAEVSGKKAAIGALKEAYKEKKHIMFDFHPRLQIRLDNIEKQHSKP